jgi:glycerol-3-phosphate acyltransferase PlsX
MEESFSVAVDAMGGDNAPEVVIEGVRDYLNEHQEENIRIVLVGKEKEIKKWMQKLNFNDYSRIDILDALEHISMKEHFFSYWRKREETSIKKALDLLKNGKASAMVSAGNTGAVMSISKTVLGSLEKVERPALALRIPTLKGNSLLVDVGANVDSRPKNLVQSALMGKIFLESVYGIKDPRVGLMSVGEEEVKGNELTKNTYNLLKKIKKINFKGNVEGRDVYMGNTDLIVTDGFTGNITLKVTEGVIDVMLSMLRREIMSNFFSKIGFFFLKRSFKMIKKRLDYSETGGALLLGVNGIVIVGHGSSNAKAIKNAINLSASFIKKQVLAKIGREMLELQNSF